MLHNKLLFIMYSFFLQFLIVHLVAYVSAETKSYTDDYGWRDFMGSIPPDAVRAGFTRDGGPIYVGQVLFENKLIPGTIVPNSDEIHFEWHNKDFSTNQNVKILCSHKSYRLVWVDTKNKELGYLTDKLLIKGGFEAGYSTYIGRTVKGGVASIGKVICTTDECLGLFTTYNGTVSVYPEFQVLTYNPLIRKSV